MAELEAELEAELAQEREAAAAASPTAPPEPAVEPAAEPEPEPTVEPEPVAESPAEPEPSAESPVEPEPSAEEPPAPELIAEPASPTEPEPPSAEEAPAPELAEPEQPRAAPAPPPPWTTPPSPWTTPVAPTPLPTPPPSPPADVDDDAEPADAWAAPTTAPLPPPPPPADVEDDTDAAAPTTAPLPPPSSSTNVEDETEPAAAWSSPTAAPLPPPADDVNDDSGAEPAAPWAAPTTSPLPPPPPPADDLDDTEPATAWTGPTTQPPPPPSPTDAGDDTETAAAPGAGAATQPLPPPPADLEDDADSGPATGYEEDDEPETDIEGEPVAEIEEHISRFGGWPPERYEQADTTSAEATQPIMIPLVGPDEPAADPWADAGPPEPATQQPIYGPQTPAGGSPYLQGAYSSGPQPAVSLPQREGPAPSGYQTLPPQYVGAARPAWWRRKSTLIVGAAVALVVLLGVFAFVAFQDDKPELTYNGDSIAEPEATLTSAERTLESIVDERNGASNDDTRCYFSVPNEDTTDVSNFLRCGPVLFVDGDESEPYLKFPLESSDGDGGVRLVAAGEPESPDPSSLEAGEALRRPDDVGAPSGSGGLAVPDPPPADEGLFEANQLTGVELETPDADAKIVSYSQSYTLTGIGQPERFGEGDTARRPADGEKFVAVKMDVGSGEVPFVLDSDPVLAVQVGDEAPMPLPAGEGMLASMVISVPEDTDVVDLVVTEQGVEQRLSLLDGAPGANNVSVLRRATRDQQTNATGNLSFSASRPGFVTASFSVDVGIPAVHLAWFFGTGGTQHPSGPSRAWLIPETTHTWGPGLEAGPDVSLDPEFFKLTLPDGTVIPATNLAVEGRILVAFDVPADFTTGTLAVGGVATRFNGETWDFGTTNLQVPINIP